MSGPFAFLESTPPMSTIQNRRPTRGVETITLGYLLAHQFPPREDLVAPWLRQGESAMLWAAPGTGKTLLTLTLAVMVAGGGGVLGWSSLKPRKVLLVDGEMSAEDLQERAAWLIGTVDGIDRDAAAANLHILSRNWQGPEVAFPDLGDRTGQPGKPSGQDEVIALASRLGAELVLMDNFSTLVEVADENDAASMNATLAFLLRLKQLRIACLLVHHSGKDGGSYRGSSKLATTFEVIIGLRPLESVATSAGAAFKLEWTKYRREPCEAVRSREVRLVRDKAGQPRWEATATMDDDMRKLLAAVESCAFGTQRAIGAHLGWDASKVSRMKMAAIKAGLMTEKVWTGCLAEAGGTADVTPDF